MKPSKSKEHLTSSHPGNVDDTEEQFRQKKARFETFGTLLNLGFAQTQKPALEASFNVAYRIAKQKKPHTTRIRFPPGSSLATVNICDVICASVTVVVWSYYLWLRHCACMLPKSVNSENVYIVDGNRTHGKTSNLSTNHWATRPYIAWTSRTHMHDQANVTTR